MKKTEQRGLIWLRQAEHNLSVCKKHLKGGKDKIGIIFKKGPEGEEEILLPIDNQTTFEHIKKFEDLDRGDIVYVEIEEVMIPSADGTLVPSKKIKKLSLIKKGKKKEIPAVTQEQVFKQEDILKSQ